MPRASTFAAVGLWAAFALLVAAIMFVLLRACGLVLPGYGSWHGLGFAFCSARAAPAPVDDGRSRELTDLVQTLELKVLQQRAACLAEAPPGRGAGPGPGPGPKPGPAAPGPSPAPPPPEPELKLPPKPTGEFAFLKGCWQTDPYKHQPTDQTGISTYCFEENGAGQLEYTRVDEPGHSCRARVTATFEGQVLRIRDSDTKCSDGSDWYADVLDCQRGANDVAECSGQSATPQGPHRWTVKLHRVR